MRYNPYTQSVDVLDSTRLIATVVGELRGDLCIISDALRRLQLLEQYEASSASASSSSPSSPAPAPAPASVSVSVSVTSAAAPQAGSPTASLDTPTSDKPESKTD